MPIAILPKTTIRDVLTQALKDSQEHSHEPLCLHLEPGRQLEFYPAAGSTATDATDVKDALIDAIANGLADGPQVWKDFDENTLKIYARALLESVLTDSDVSTVAQLTRLVKSTTKLRIAGDASVAADDEVRTIMSIAAMISHPEWQTTEGLVKGALDDLAYFKPVRQAEDLLKLDYARTISTQNFDPNAPAVRTYRALTVLMAATEGELHTAATMQEAKREFIGNVALQYAFLEAYCAKIQNNEVANADEWMRIALHFTQLVSMDAFGTIFLPNESVDILARQASRLRPKDAQEFKARISVLRKNSNRFESYRKSALGAIPSLTGVSREFLVQMFERLNGKFRVLQSSNQQPLFDYVLDPKSEIKSSIVQTRIQENSSEVAAWELQLLLGELTPDEEPDKWNEAAEHFGKMRLDNARQIFAYEDTVAALEHVLRASARGDLAQNAVGMLGCLKNNAVRFKAFMESGISDMPEFYDVDRMLVIPWSEVVKRALPQQASPQKEPGEQGERGEPDPPQDSSSPAVVMHAQTAQAPQLPASETPIPESKTSPSSAASSAADSAPAAQRLPPQNQVRAFQESKQPRQTVQTPQKTAVHAQPAQAVLSRPGQRLPSANPWRKDRPPTGNERRNFEEAADHHNRGRFRWLSRDARRSAREQAETRAARTHAPQLS